MTLKKLLSPATPVNTPVEIEAAYALGLLRKEELVHGAYYRGTCRNAEVARWHAGAERFLYARTKFGSKYLEPIAHPVDERRYDVFMAVQAIDPTDATSIDDDSFEHFFSSK